MNITDNANLITDKINLIADNELRTFKSAMNICYEHLKGDQA